VKAGTPPEPNPDENPGENGDDNAVLIAPPWKMSQIDPDAAARNLRIEPALYSASVLTAPLPIPVA